MSQIPLCGEQKEVLTRAQAHPDLIRTIEDSDPKNLENFYENTLMRQVGVGTELRARIEAAGLYDTEPFNAVRQVVYRRIAHLRYGVIMPGDGSPMHHPV